ncbi:uncharacterized protein LOC110816846 isoform X3 [Carica papaya]|uniref:uncharacterized protein LOC110816846 isoform X3 n=1 Tax=Carica papaya TaxID=3649 RepID=UPI000B8C870F|nr:uncharacterized protein LOC110816846 isoform X3 [Carica papaya]
MAGSKEQESENLKSEDCSFVWDDTTQLYFHASTGFYHDPNSGLYYSSRDGLYYKFENGKYVLLDSSKVEECQMYPCEETVWHDSAQEDANKDIPYNPNDNDFTFQGDESEASKRIKTVCDEHSAGPTEYSTSQPTENPPPPSEWLEDTLINLYLSGYNVLANTAAEPMMHSGIADEDNFKLSGENDTQELEEGEWIPDDDHDLTDLSGRVLDKGLSVEEESWQAQYGQVIRSTEEPMPGFPVVDLWDWEMVIGTGNGRKQQVTRLVGRLMKRSTKLHPSVPSGGRLLKTAPICEVHLDLVRVTTGVVYKLRTPSVRHLESLSTYNSSNPTKDWGFPELSVEWESSTTSKSDEKGKLAKENKDAGYDDLDKLSDQVYVPEKQRKHAYRDRAAERRILHGGFGGGPGQKSMVAGDFGNQISASTREEAAAEALDMSLGAGSYARRILKGMGWKEGEGLGKTTKGLVEPIQAIGNEGNAGLGWPRGRTKQR